MESDRGKLLRLLAHSSRKVNEVVLQLPKKSAILYLHLINAVWKSRAAAFERTDSGTLVPASTAISQPTLYQLLYYMCRLVELKPSNVITCLEQQVEEAENLLEGDLVTADILETDLERPLLPQELVMKAPLLNDLFDNDSELADVIAALLDALGCVRSVCEAWLGESVVRDGGPRVDMELVDLICNGQRSEELLKEWATSTSKASDEEEFADSDETEKEEREAKVEEVPDKGKKSATSSISDSTQMRHSETPDSYFGCESADGVDFKAQQGGAKGEAAMKADIAHLSEKIKKLEGEVDTMRQALRQAKSGKVAAEYKSRRLNAQMARAVESEKAVQTPDKKNELRAKLDEHATKKRTAELNTRLAQAALEGANNVLEAVESMRSDCEGNEAMEARLRGEVERATQSRTKAAEEVKAAKLQQEQLGAAMAQLAEELQGLPAVGKVMGVERPRADEVAAADQEYADATVDVKMLEARMRPKATLLAQWKEERAGAERHLDEALRIVGDSTKTQPPSPATEKARVAEAKAETPVKQPKFKAPIAKKPVSTPIKIVRSPVPAAESKPLAESAKKMAAEIRRTQAKPRKSQAEASELRKGSTEPARGEDLLAGVMRPALRSAPTPPAPRAAAAAAASPANKPSSRRVWEPHKLSAPFPTEPPFAAGFPIVLDHTDAEQSKALRDGQKDSLSGANIRVMSDIHHEVSMALVCDYLARVQFDDDDLAPKSFGQGLQKTRYTRPIKVYCAKLMLEYALEEHLEAPPFYAVDYSFLRNFLQSRRGEEVQRRYPALINTVLAKLLLSIDVIVFHNADDSERSNYASLSKMAAAPGGYKKLYDKISTHTLAGLSTTGRELLRATMLADKGVDNWRELLVRVRQRFVHAGLRMTAAPALLEHYTKMVKVLTGEDAPVPPRPGTPEAVPSTSRDRKRPRDGDEERPARKRAADAGATSSVRSVVTAVHAAYEAAPGRVSQRTVENEVRLEASTWGVSGKGGQQQSASAKSSLEKAAAADVKSGKRRSAQVGTTAAARAKAQAAVFASTEQHSKAHGSGDEVEVLDAVGMAASLPSIFDDLATAVPWVVQPDGQMEPLERTRQRVRVGRPLCVADRDTCVGAPKLNSLGDPKEPATVAHYHHKYGYSDVIATSGTLRGLKKKLNEQVTALCGRSVDVDVILCRVADADPHWPKANCTAADEGALPNASLTRTSALVMQRQGHSCGMHFVAVALFISDVVTKEESIRMLQNVGAYMYHLLPSCHPPWMYNEVTDRLCTCQGAAEGEEGGRGMVKQFGCLGVRQDSGDYRFRCASGLGVREEQFVEDAEAGACATIKEFVDRLADKAGLILQLGAPIAYCNQVLYSQCSAECRQGSCAPASPISYCQVLLDAAMHTHRSETETSVGATVRFVIVDESLSENHLEANSGGRTDKERVRSEQRMLFPQLQRQNVQGKVSPDVGMSFPLEDGSVVICALSLVDTAVSPPLHTRMAGVPTTVLMDFGLSHGINEPNHGSDEADATQQPQDEDAAAAQVIAAMGIPDGVLDLNGVD